jgi:hypothetical protein
MYIEKCKKMRIMKKILIFTIIFAISAVIVVTPVMPAFALDIADDPDLRPPPAGGGPAPGSGGSCAGPQTLQELVCAILGIMNMLVAVIVGIALLVFLWGVMRYVIASDVKSKADGRNFIIWGIIGLAVMLSVWGLVNFVKNTFFPGGVPPLW